MIEPDPDPYVGEFSQVLSEELILIRDRRRAILLEAGVSLAEDWKPGVGPGLTSGDADRRMTSARLDALDEHLTGIAFSGGGIRSGTFAVGLLQGLASLNLLRRFDYLSTVSGGGYAGGWLAAWLKRDGCVENVEHQLAPSRVRQGGAWRDLLTAPSGVDPRSEPSCPMARRVVDEEPEPIRHLRSYSSYMAPRFGLLTADTWTIIQIWLRNVTVNMLMFLPLAMVLVLTVRLLVNFYGTLTSDVIGRSPGLQRTGLAALVYGVLLLYLAFYYNGRSLREFRVEPARRWWADQGAGIYRWMIFPTLFACFLFSLGLRPVLWWLGDLVEPDPLAVPVARAASAPLSWQWALDWLYDQFGRDLGLLGVPNVLLHAATVGSAFLSGAFVANLLNGTIRTLQPRKSGRLDLLLDLATASTLSASGVGLVVLSINLPIAVLGRARPALMAALLVLGLVVLGVVAFGLATRRRFRWDYLRGALIAGSSGGVMLTLVEYALTTLSDAGRPELVAMLGTPAILLVLTVSLIIEVALLGRGVTEAEREWWSRFGALTLIGGVLWIASFAAILFVPALFLGLGLPIRLLITSGWLATVAGGVLAGQRVRPASKGGSSVLGLIAAVAPPIFLIGLVGAVSLGVAMMVNDPKVAFPEAGAEVQGIANYLTGLRGAPMSSIVAWMVICGGLAAIGLLLIDVNLFSLNAMYANRLIRCYLGATRSKRNWKGDDRRPGRWSGDHDRRIPTGAPTITSDLDRDENPVTGFDPTDDIALIDLKIGHRRPGHPEDRAYRGPMLLVNTAINLVGGDELAWRDRKGESFTLSPLYCGSKGTGYALVADSSRENLTLGRAMSISGAAVDPNMRFYQSTSLTAFLTLLNARLGYWMENPAGPRKLAAGRARPNWSAESPKFGSLLFSEFLGQTDGRGDYVHLSDGGHFENMGVYELIRRRCRYIVACDAGEDTGPSDENLATLMRLVRIDFGVRIEVDTAPFLIGGPDDLARAHVIIGRVHYEDVDSGQFPGILVYVRISMTGDEPPDVQQYARSAPSFPHQPTDLRQSFTEDQFESYRALGEHIARSVFGDAAARARDDFWKESDPHREFVRGNRRLFSELAGRWADTPIDQATRAVESSAAWIAIRKDLREEEKLIGLVAEAFPEGISSGLEDRRVRPEMQTVGQMLQMMENAWLELGLAGRAALPTNRGWMNAFRRWVGTEAFRKYWPVFRAELSPDFSRFLEKELHLAPPRKIRRELARVKPPGLVDESIAVLAEEFDREWPAGDSGGSHFADLIAPAWPVSRGGNRAWLLFLAPSGPAIEEGGDLPPGAFVIGAAWLIEGPSGNDDLEFCAWIRRPHRASGLGNSLVGPLIEKIRKGVELDPSAAGRTRKIRTRYPKSGREGDDDGERDRWLNFFSMYDFHPESPESRDQNKGSSAILKISVPSKEANS